MKRFSSISDWLKTNPSNEEQNKVLLLIMRGHTSQLRKELYEKERRLVKLQSFARYCSKMGFSPSKQEAEETAKIKSEIERLRKELPVIPKKEKKEKEVLAEQPQE
jgi:hypothetical protein